MLKIKISEDTFKKLDEMVQNAPKEKELTHEYFVEKAVHNYHWAYLIGQAAKKQAEQIAKQLWTEEELEQIEKDFNERNEKQDVEKSEN